MVVNSLDGGVAQFIYNYCSNMNLSHLDINIYAEQNHSELYKRKFAEIGVEITKIPRKKDNIYVYLKTMYQIFKVKKYDIIHCHLTLMNFLPLAVAKKCEIPTRISHSHMAEPLTILKRLFRILSNSFCTERFACSEAAGNFLFKDKRYIIFRNAIEVEKYEFDASIRYSERRNLGIRDDDFVVGHVGRFTKQKNHKYLIDVYKEILNIKKNSKLILIGEGEQKKIIEDRIKEDHLSDNVIFLGEILDVNRKMNIFDVFVLPSLYEGLPLVGVEAQANGIPCFFSTNITKEIAINQNAYFLCIKEKPSYWAKEIISKSVRNQVSSTLNTRGYNIKLEARKLETFYIQN